MERNKTVCFTGHRQIRVQDSHLAATLYSRIEHLIVNGYVYFVTGGARGFDTLAAQTVLLLQRIYPHIQLILILPFNRPYEQEPDWTDEDIEKYRLVKQQANTVVSISDRYVRGCYYARNKALVDCSSVCICYQYRKSGGTAYTTSYAVTRGLTVINCL